MTVKRRYVRNAKIKKFWTSSTPKCKLLTEKTKRSMTYFIFDSLWYTGRIQTEGSLNDDVWYGFRIQVDRGWHHRKREMEADVQHISCVNNRAVLPQFIAYIQALWLETASKWDMNQQSLHEEEVCHISRLLCYPISLYTSLDEYWIKTVITTREIKKYHVPDSSELSLEMEQKSGMLRKSLFFRFH
jgi:hypothetical protein